MKLPGYFAAGLAAICALSQISVSAQDVVFRRPIPKADNGAYEWEATAYRPVDSSGNTLDASNICGTVEVRRSLNCVRTSGGMVDPTYCSALAKPAVVSTQDYSSGCTYSWSTSGWVDPGASCTGSETQSRSVSCRVDQTGATTSNGNCGGAAPASTRTVSDFTGCSYSWDVGAWVDPGASCSAAEAQTRTVNCRRSDGATVAGSNCSGAQPATSRTVSDFSSCSYAWKTNSWGAWSNSCASSATRSRSAYCERSDGTTVADSNCSGTKPVSSESGSNYSGCTYSYQTGSWVDPGPSCTSSEVQSRSVTCKRSNGDTVANSNCSGATPSSTRTVSDYSDCTAQTSVKWGEWIYSSTCSASATKTRTAICMVDGKEVNSSLCSTYGGKPVTQTATESNMTGCNTCSPGENWKQLGYGRCSGTPTNVWTESPNEFSGSPTRSYAEEFCKNNGGTCFETDRWTADESIPSNTSYNAYQGYSCFRDQGGNWVEWGNGDGYEAFSPCDSGPFTWQTSSWTAWSSTCSASATRSRNVNCKDRLGNGVYDSRCTTPKPASTETASVTTGC